MAGEKYYHTIKVHIKEAQNLHHEIPPFKPLFIKVSRNVCYEVNLTLQRSHLNALLLMPCPFKVEKCFVPVQIF